MLTPIKTRGRRKRPWAASDGAPKPIASGPKGGRPMLSLQAKHARSQYSGIKRARLLVAGRPPPKPRNKLSRLESLPVELIEKIFLYSLNVNLPRCSQSISAAVSSERVYRALTLLALWDDSYAQRSLTAGDPAIPESPSTPEVAAAVTSETEISRLLRPLDYVPLLRNERKHLQTNVLRCRWCTIERLLSYLPDLMRLTVQRHWLSADENHYTLSITPFVSITVTCLETEKQTTHPIIGVLEIPDKLLSGTAAGFSENHARFLEIVRIASGFNRSDVASIDITFSREAIQQGIHTALIEHYADALTTLLKIDEYTFRGENTSATQTLPYMIPPEHFRTAVRVARDDPKFFNLLLRASAESLPADDSEITQWAMELGGSFGPWLLDFMLQLPERIKAATNDPVNGSMFYLGGMATQLPIALRYLRDVLGLEGLDKWMGESPYDFVSEWVVRG
ncbi:hypothetical protein ASPSYDRAFT_157274 [Aspergillus sydowii CBS 593.65]|uniref:Uncharacterized protein n=1 Tax=Aspergillus sydowii CBS 593.65 TaxID=1036612 RepID=A0A1L9T8Z8_9EURO|nr:uncharacterized protein ASPSYDRAFT_157274 [Aspergillus sydowii CBS 593.65]OJJ55835.1 hypothetical protein ASPSYDRAFT_157274 [Aspergillus sydowii CBS 593.65]